MKKIMPYIKTMYATLMRYPRSVACWWHIRRLPKPIVTIFGGRNVPKEHRYYRQAFALAQELAHRNYSVITGGGDGIMEAGLCGALAGAKSGDVRYAGIGVYGVDTSFASSCNIPTYFVANFALRKSLLIDYAAAIVIFPGGIGTLNEATEVLNLLKVHGIQKLPIIFVDQDYWQPMITWFDQALAEGLILPPYKHIFSVHTTNEAIIKEIVTRASRVR